MTALGSGEESRAGVSGAGTGISDERDRPVQAAPATLPCQWCGAIQTHFWCRWVAQLCPLTRPSMHSVGRLREQMKTDVAVQGV